MNSWCAVCGKRPKFNTGDKGDEKIIVCIACEAEHRDKEILFVRCTNCDRDRHAFLTLTQAQKNWGAEIIPFDKPPSLLLLEYCQWCANGRPMENRRIGFHYSI